MQIKTMDLALNTGIMRQAEGVGHRKLFVSTSNGIFEADQFC